MSKFADNIILKKTKLFWPIIMFPFYERSHTLEYTGKGRVKDVKFRMNFATLYLTERILFCRLICLPITIIEIALSDITNISSLKDKHGILEIQFNKAKKAALLTRFALSGHPAIPKDKVLLNLGDESETWYRELANESFPNPH